MICRCNKCVEHEKEFERLAVLTRLSPNEIITLNEDKLEATKMSLWIGIGIGLLGGLGLALALVR